MHDVAIGLAVERLALTLQAKTAAERLSPRERTASALRAYAVRTVPWYRDRRSAEARAVVDRATVSADQTSFVSEDCGGQQLVTMTTSGTEGRPLRVVRDLGSWYRLVCESYRHVFDFIPELGEVKPGSVAVLQLNDNPALSDQLAANPALDLAFVRRSILGRGVSADRRVLERAMTERPMLLYGRPAALVAFAELARGSGLMPRPRALLCSGDTLLASQRRYIEETFGLSPHDAYASQEGGFMALECCQHDGLHVLDDRALVEVRRGDGSAPLSCGDGELVVTNLENWAMPFVSYATGDTGSLSQGACRCGHRGSTIRSLHGRITPAFTLAGREINPWTLNPIFETLPIARFSVRQRVDESLLVRVELLPGANESKVRQAISRALRARGAIAIEVKPAAFGSEKAVAYTRSAM